MGFFFPLLKDKNGIFFLDMLYFKGLSVIASG